MSSIQISVPEEHGALQLFQLRGGRVHPADPVLWGAPKVGVPEPGDLEPVHEEVCQDCGEGVDGVCGHADGRLPQPSQGREDGKWTWKCVQTQR